MEKSGSSMRGWALVAAAIAALHALSLGSVVPVDDDYIVYRYARNWLEQGSYAFNAGGAPTDGVTSPLWFLLCALGLRLGASPEAWTAAIGVASFACLAWIVGRSAALVLPRRFASLPPLLIAASPALAWHARAGLGTLPMALTIGIAVHFWLQSAGGARGRTLLKLGLGLAVATAFRLEALVLVPPLAWSVRRARAVLAVALPPVLVLVAVSTWRHVAFGSAVPSAALLKALPLTAELEYGASYVLRSVGEGGLSALLGLAALLAFSSGHALRPLGSVALLALLAVIAVGGDWMVYGRFFAPFASIGALGASVLFVGRSQPLVRGAGVALLSVLTVLGFRARSQAVFENEFFEQWWLDVGDALEAGAPPGARIALSPVGAIGWRSGLEVVDVLGLTHREFLGLDPDLGGVGVKGHHRHDGGWVLGQEPDYLLLGNAVLQPDTGKLSINPWEADIVGDPRASAGYVQRSLPIARSDGSLQVLPYFRKRGAPDLVAAPADR